MIRTTRRVSWAVLVVGISMAAGPSAQTPAAPSFEAASVKMNRSGPGAAELGFQQGGRFRAVNETVWRLIGEAYTAAQPLPRFRIVGGPGWIDAERFDVEAVALRPVGDEQGRLMLRTLLADRFALVAHEETRELPVYDLVRARANGALGPDLHRSTVDCASLRADAPGPPAGQTRPCVMRFGLGQLSAIGLTLPEFAAALSRYANRVVVDRTNLSGAFDWSLRWTPDQLRDLKPSGDVVPGALPRINGVPFDPNGPSLFTALQEQLGLKLESTRGPVPVVVIDSIERPTPD
jgi:uncharacterized protein (TIGR03435 family)